MAARTGPGAQRRATLSKDRVLRAAVGLADEGGLASLTMRKLAQQLGVEAMSLYYHVADKDEVLDGMAEAVMGEINARVDAIDVASSGAGWKPAVRQRILSAREVLLRHTWAPGLIESRTTMSPAVLRYYDSLAGLLRKGGFSVDLVHHAMHALGSRALGFTQELFDEQNNADPGPEVTAIMVGQLAKEYPHISAVVMGASHDAGSTLGWCDDQFEFEFGLDLILDGLERLRDTGSEQEGSGGHAVPAEAS
jgi:AcrR family transcriptional regulator